MAIGEFCTQTQTPECFYGAPLTSLYGLRSLRAVGGNLTVENNPALPACETDWLLDSIGPENIGGTVTFGGNDGPGTCTQANESSRVRESSQRR